VKLDSGKSWCQTFSANRQIFAHFPSYEVTRASIISYVSRSIFYVSVRNVHTVLSVIVAKTPVFAENLGRMEWTKAGNGGEVPPP
jgi:hypothetical protein